MAEVQLIEPRYVETSEILVMGIETRTTNQKEALAETAQIPDLWDRFFTEQLVHKIPDAIQPEVFLGVYTDYWGNSHSEYAVLAAIAVSSIDNPPEGMVGITIPSGEYLVFTAQGEPPHSTRLAWKQVSAYFETHLECDRTYTTDFERYPSPDQVEVYVAIRRKR